MTYRILAVAHEDLASATTFYEQQSEGLGGRFLPAFEEAMQRVLQCPDAWPFVSANQRRCLFRRFPFAILCMQDGEGILVSAVVDLRMDPARFEQRKRHL